jgi:hypothetical protein
MIVLRDMEGRRRSLFCSTMVVFLVIDSAVRELTVIGCQFLLPHLSSSSVECTVPLTHLVATFVSVCTVRRIVNSRRQHKPDL